MKEKPLFALKDYGSLKVCAVVCEKRRNARSILDQAFSLQEIGEGFEFGIPCFAESADEGLAQETIDGQSEFATFGHGRRTDGPTVVVECYGAVGERLLANGVKRATDGLGPVDAPLAKRTIGGAETKTVVVIARKTAFSSADDAGNEVAVAVAIGYSLLVEHFAGAGTELHAHGRQHTLQFATLLGRDRGTGFAFDAAGSATGGEIATKMFGENIGRQEHVAYLENGEHGKNRTQRAVGDKERRERSACFLKALSFSATTDYHWMGVSPRAAK